MTDRFDTKWDLRFLEMAKLVSEWSKDPSTRCGAVIVRPDKTVASVGFNGFPKGCDDSPHLYEDRDLKLSRVVHAEQNALLNTGGERLDGYTLFTWPPGYGPSCDRCTAHVIQAGIGRVVYRKVEEEGFSSRWQEAVERGLDMYKEAGVDLTPYTQDLHTRFGGKTVKAIA
jgi:dCMP deaminase